MRVTLQAYRTLPLLTKNSLSHIKDSQYFSLYRKSIQAPKDSVTILKEKCKAKHHQFLSLLLIMARKINLKVSIFLRSNDSHRGFQSQNRNYSIMKISIKNYLRKMSNIKTLQKTIIETQRSFHQLLKKSNKNLINKEKDHKH